MARGGEIFFRVSGEPLQENSVGSGVVWVTGLFSLLTAINISLHGQVELYCSANAALEANPFEQTWMIILKHTFDVKNATQT